MSELIRKAQGEAIKLITNKQSSGGEIVLSLIAELERQTLFYNESTDKCAELRIRLNNSEKEITILTAELEGCREVVQTAKDLFTYKISFNDFDHTYCDALREALNKIDKVNI